MRFTARDSDSIVVRVGEVTDSGNFEPQIRLYDPAGAQVVSSAEDLAAQIAVTAPSFFINTTATTDIYTLSLHDALPISGTYRLHLAKSPGAFVVSGGDEGGDLI